MSCDIGMMSGPAPSGGPPQAGGEHDGTQGLVFTYIGSGYSVSAGTVTGGVVVIPATYNGLPVISINDYAFSGRSSLTGVILPSGVTSIGHSAFEGCSGLTGVTIPSNVTSIGQYAFYGCSGLTSVTIPSNVRFTGRGSFVNCTSLTSVTISSGVTYIGEDAFGSCTSLISVTIPSSVTSIGNRAFYNCANLADVIIPTSVTSVGDAVFGWWSDSQTINVQGHASQVSADAAWGMGWRADCYAIINYNG